MNLAPRKGFEDFSGTPVNIAPNTYTITYPRCKYALTHYAPFLTNTQRTTLKSKCYTDAIYDPPIIRSKIKYGISPQFRGPRNTIDINVSSARKEALRQPAIKKPCPKPNVGKLYMCRVPFTLEASAPSIPTDIDANGYDLTEDNRLIKMPPDEFDNTLGPAFYSVPMGELSYNTTKYKGCTWSKMKGKRSNLQINNNPGPSDYDVKFVTCVFHKEHEKFKELMRKCCNVPRYTCQLICRAKNENHPGPGYYESVDTSKMGKIKNLSLNSRPFINGSPRFVSKVAVGPGPQTYPVCDCYKHRKDFSLKDVPFLRESSRFDRRKIATSPGPGEYEICRPKCSRYMEDKQQASFNCTAERKLLEVLSTTPGPGEYCIRMKGPRCCPQEGSKQSHVFSSRTCRFQRKRGENEPSPACYSIAEAFKFNNGKQSHAKRNVSFSRTEAKFNRIYDFAGFVYGLDTPGIGKYNLPQFPTTLGKTFPMDPRFRCKPEETPGPGTYTLHPVVGEAVYRGKTTHNVRLMKNVREKLVKATPKKSATKKTKAVFDDD